MSKFIIVAVMALTLSTMNIESNSLQAKKESVSSFLKLPFEKDTQFSITEGWIYSQEEQAIHGNSLHRGIDFAVPYGTPVYASSDGYALSSSHISTSGKIFQGKEVGFSYGNFVRIWHPEMGLFTQYSHLAEIAPQVPYEKPIKSGGSWLPTSIFDKSPQTFESDGIFLKAGDLIGYAGDSGLSWGYEEMPRKERDRSKFPSWDEPHVHFELFSQVKDGNTRQFIDPYGIYGSRSDYELIIGNEKMYWVTNVDGKPEFVR